MSEHSSATSDDGVNGIQEHDNPSRPRILGQVEFSHAERIELIESSHAFPGIFPIVVIAASDAEFLMTLETTVAAEQGEAPFRIRRRLSREGHYASYRVEIHVESAEMALARQAVLAALPGIRALL